jgi:hypothetical protein
MVSSVETKLVRENLEKELNIFISNIEEKRFIINNFLNGVFNNIINLLKIIIKAYFIYVLVFSLTLTILESSFMDNYGGFFGLFSFFIFNSITFWLIGCFLSYSLEPMIILFIVPYMITLTIILISDLNKTPLTLILLPFCYIISLYISGFY